MTDEVEADPAVGEFPPGPEPEVERIAGLPLEERPQALAGAVRRLEAALEATESRAAPRRSEAPRPR